MNINRRTVVRTAAWTVPAVAVVSSAPAFAGTAPTLTFSFTVITSDLASSAAVDCNDLTITIDNSKSNIALELTKVETMLGTSVVNTAPANTIAAGATSITTAAEQGQSIPFAVTLSWKIYFKDAAGVDQMIQTDTLNALTCGESATASHTSTA